MLEILLPLFGFFVGIIAALTGIGGGTFIVPLLTLLYAFEPANAAGTSLTTIIFTALAATLNYWRQKRIYYKTGLVLAVTTAPGAVLGAYLTQVITARQLGLIFGFFLILIAFRMTVNFGFLRRNRPSANEKKPDSTAKSDSELFRSGRIIVLGAGLSFFGGLASGLLGIGGGALIVAIMTLVMGMSIHVATATSMFTMIFTSMSGVAEHYAANHISIEYAIPLALGTVIGAQVGAYASKRISGRNLRWIFAIMLVAVGAQMILKYI
jgi:hypothetical protein